MASSMYRSNDEQLLWQARPPFASLRISRYFQIQSDRVRSWRVRRIPGDLYMPLTVDCVLTDSKRVVKVYS